MNISSARKLRTHVVLLKPIVIFKTRYAKPLRHPYGNLTYRIALKHRNSVLNSENLEKDMSRSAEIIFFNLWGVV